MLTTLRHVAIHFLLPAGAYCDLCEPQHVAPPFDASGPDITITRLTIDVDGRVRDLFDDGGSKLTMFDGRPHDA